MSKRTHRSGARPSRALQSTLTPGELDSSALDHRHGRLERVLLQELQRLVRDEAADPALDGVRLLAIGLSLDGGHARLAYAVEAPLADEQRVVHSARAAFARATGFLRARLALLLDRKRVPTLTFTFVGVQGPDGGDPQGGGDRWYA